MTRRFAAWATTVAAALTLVACGGGEDRKLVGYRVEPVPSVGAFTVEDASNGNTPFPLRAQPGRLLIMYIGFTNCPDACPTAMNEVSQVLDRLGPDSDRLDVAMLTVDPTRDTPAVLSTFVDTFTTRGHALRTDDETELRAIVTAFGSEYATEHDQHGMTSQVGHTDHTFVVDDNGDVILTWTAEMTTDDQEKDLRTLLAQIND